MDKTAHIPDRSQPEAGSRRELLHVAGPLVISTGSLSLMYFVDRVFLAWYSLDAFTAAMPACMFHFMLISLFLGTATYVNSFVAQYEGARRPQRVGAALWQGLYFAMAASAVVLCVAPFSWSIFAWLGHDASIRELEAEYFAVLCIGTAPILLQATLACFYSGRGKTRVIMYVNLFTLVLNGVLAYLFIFGAGPIPSWGIGGAAAATVLSNLAGAMIFAYAMFGSKLLDRYGLWTAWRVDRELCVRLLRYGFPNGVHLFMDVVCFTLFIHLLGMMGKAELAASNLAFNVNSLAFVPMLGIGTAISTLVGQRIGEGRPELAVRTTWTAFKLTGIYMLGFCAVFVLLPDLILLPYQMRMQNPSEFVSLREQVIVLLRFVAVYSLFDAMTIVFGSAIRGAGDTRFSLLLITGLGWLLMVIPTYLAYRYASQPMLLAWTAGTVYIVVLGIGFVWRFQGGKWKTMRVIEPDFEEGPCAITPQSPMPSPVSAVLRELNPYAAPAAEEMPA